MSMLRFDPIGNAPRRLGAFLIAFAALATDAHARSEALIVKLRSEGPTTIEACAEGVHRRGERFATASSMGSDSLDRLMARHPMRRVRALFARRGAAGRGTSLAERRRALAQGSDLAHVYRMELAGVGEADAALEALRDDPHVAWVQRDHQQVLDTWSTLPDDPFLFSRGSWGQPYADLWSLPLIGVPEAWQIARGEGVVVAVVDTGLDYMHPDIAANVWINPGEDLNGNGVVDASDWNGIDDDGNGYVDDIRGYDFAGGGEDEGDEDTPEGQGAPSGDPDPFDVSGHGTHVAGTIAAVADNGIGIAGVAPEVRVMALKGFDASGRGRDSALWEAVLYAARNGARVINTSWSCFPLCPENPLAEETLALVHELGAGVVTSAGNRNTDIVKQSPEKLDRVITVAATSERDTLADSFSNFGWLIDVGAPGGDPTTPTSIPSARRNILSLRSSADDDSAPYAVGEDYFRLSGTSMATPHVAGVVALMISARPELRYAQIRRILRVSAADIGPPGRDRSTGAGRLDALAAVSRAAAAPPPDLRLAFSSPEQGAILPSGRSAIEVRGTVTGLDLQRWTLELGIGKSPTEWRWLVDGATSFVEEDVLARWLPSAEEAGEVLLRLRAYGREGSLYEELLHVSVEGARSRRITRPGHRVEAPRLSRDWVLWSSTRRFDDPLDRDDARNLYATHLRSGREVVVANGEGDVRFAALAGDLAVWRDERRGPRENDLYGCYIDPSLPSDAACPEIPIAIGLPDQRLPVAAGGHVFWMGSAADGHAIHRCRPDEQNSRCLDRPIPGTGLQRVSLTAVADRLVWIERGAGTSRIAACDVDAETGSCEPFGIELEARLVSDPLSAGRVFAWTEFTIYGTELRVCWWDEESGTCPPITVAAIGVEAEPRLSGRRLVWAGNVGDQSSDIFFCDFDALRMRCPVQRLTSELGRQREADLEGDRLAWLDDRSGTDSVHGMRLPSLEVGGRRWVREGMQLRIPIRFMAAGQGPLDVEVVAEGAESLAEVGARLVEPAHRRHRTLAFRPKRGQAGVQRFTVAVVTPGGLRIEQSLDVEVQPRRKREGARWLLLRWLFAWLFGG